MAESLADTLMALLNVSPLWRVRRNHGLEHATLHILGRRFPHTGFGGFSDLRGFWIVGDVSADDLQSAVDEALQRLCNGEENLALHPNCGTNFAAAGLLAGFAAFLGMMGSGRRFRDKLERLPLVVTLATLALIIAQPLGMLLQQRVTTSGRPESLEVVNIASSRFGRAWLHRVITEG